MGRCTHDKAFNLFLRIVARFSYWCWNMEALNTHHEGYLLLLVQDNTTPLLLRKLEQVGEHFHKRSPRPPDVYPHLG